MELNREQIRYKMSEMQIKTALKCLSKPNSSPVDREKCYFMWKEPSCLSCHHEVAQNALALITSQEQRIKELTEENERLENALIEQSAENVMLCGEVKHARTDTVRKMQEEARQMCFIVGDEEYVALYDLDQIAKEMTGEKND